MFLIFSYRNMKKIIKIIRISWKEWFKNLRDKWPIYCKAINCNFTVSNLFLNHISWSSKKRKLRDIIERLSSINLVEKVWLNWILLEERWDVIVENKRKFIKTFKIVYEISKIDFFLVLWEKKDWKIVLISTFLNIKDK